MKKLAILIGLAVCLAIPATSASAQSPTKILLEGNAFSGYKYSLDGGATYTPVGMSGGGLMEAMSDNPEAQAELEKFQSKYLLAMLLGGGGGFALGYGIGSKTAGLTAGGAVVAGLGLILSINASKHIVNSVAIYNGET